MPRAPEACSAAASRSAARAAAPGNACSTPASAYSDGSSCDGLRPRSCTSSESVSGDRSSSARLVKIKGHR